MLGGSSDDDGGSGPLDSIADTVTGTDERTLLPGGSSDQSSSESSDSTESSGPIDSDDAGRVRAFIEDTTDPMDTQPTLGGVRDTIENAANSANETVTDAVDNLRDEADASTTGDMETTERADELAEESPLPAWLSPTVLLAGAGVAAVAVFGGDA
ncbi:hypothetical protein Nmn1133_01390 [Halosegnis longus]|uniref:Uncharacterized protein n=2 Tax=Halosegnis longus TaxID=2216012 RepID=A0AAJ4UV03_9EURY|nr:hypothetical protein Nmn1133_01390 [Salella cibi]